MNEDASPFFLVFFLFFDYQTTRRTPRTLAKHLRLPRLPYTQTYTTTAPTHDTGLKGRRDKTRIQVQRRGGTHTHNTPRIKAAAGTDKTHPPTTQRRGKERHDRDENDRDEDETDGTQRDIPLYASCSMNLKPTCVDQNPSAKVYI